jgi:hypothetical protein
MWFLSQSLVFGDQFKVRENYAEALARVIGQSKYTFANSPKSDFSPIPGPIDGIYGITIDV